MNKILIEILQRIPEDSIPTICLSAENGVIHWDNGDKDYLGDIGHIVTWSIEKDGELYKTVHLSIYPKHLDYSVENHETRHAEYNIPFNLEKFVKHFNV